MFFRKEARCRDERGWDTTNRVQRMCSVHIRKLEGVWIFGHNLRTRGVDRLRRSYNTYGSIGVT